MPLADLDLAGLDLSTYRIPDSGCFNDLHNGRPVTLNLRFAVSCLASARLLAKPVLPSFSDLAGLPWLLSVRTSVELTLLLPAHSGDSSAHHTSQVH